MNLSYSIDERHSGIQILKVHDLLSEHANKEILTAAQQRIDAGQNRFVIDLSQIRYMNSVGLNFLITLRARSQEYGGDIAVANPSEKVMDLLNMTKLAPIFRICPTVEAAEQAFTP
jgi:anti-sigma B factor antagonist